MTKPVTTCDVEGCQEVRKEVNHWFKVVIISETLFQCIPFDSNVKLDGEVKDVCGAKHAQVMFDRFLSKGKFEVDMPDEKA